MSMTLRIRTACLIALMVILAVPGASAAPPPDVTGEYRLKAALMYRIAKFVRWPDAAIADDLGICVLGEDPFGRSLDELEALQVRDVRIRTYRKINLRDLGADCAVVFVSESERSRLDIVLSRLGGQPVLTIADFDGFSDAGGMIEFSRSASRIGFKVNVDASERAGLQISSQLLQVASTVVRSTAP